MNTGGPASRGLVDVPGVVHQLGNSLFSVANGVHNALGGDGHAEHRNVPGPPAHANANATAGTQAPPAPANANPHAHPNRSAARRDGKEDDSTEEYRGSP